MRGAQLASQGGLLLTHRGCHLLLFLAGGFHRPGLFGQLPVQRLEQFASGQGIWNGLSVDVRREQLMHMVTLIDELYPTFRLFLYDGREVYSAPYTLFGPLRAALYVGDMFLVVTWTDHICALTSHFDHLIRMARFGPDRVAGKVVGLAKTL